MQLLNNDYFATVFLSIIFSSLALPPMILLMHFLMPKDVLLRYWRTPHFRPAELFLFTGTIYAPMRTVMLMAVIAFPVWGRRRDITRAFTLAPSWYRTASKAVCIWIIVTAGGGIAITLLLFVVGYLTGDPLF